jgi:putative ABC transport system ATP-binding protein
MIDRWLKKRKPPGLGVLNGQDRPEVARLVDVRQAVKCYKSAAGVYTALKGVNLQIHRGEFVAVVGKSGSGKSTLLNIIAGIDHLTAGEVIVDHTAVHLLRERQIAPWRGRTIGVIFQFFQLLPTLTVVENVMLPMGFCHMFTPRERLERALHLLERVDLADHAHKLPTALSGGQQQRVAIARALANDPPILLADEPTGNLDSQTAEAVFRVFADLVDSGKTILMVTHDADLARQVTRAIHLGDGEVIDEVINQRTPLVGRD